MSEKHEENQSSKQSATDQVQKQEKLSKEDKENLQVKDGQNNHDVDERGGF